MAELDRAAISARLQESRELAGLTQPEIANLLGVHFRTIQDWESQKMRVVPFDRLQEWATITHVTREWLLHGPEPTPPGRVPEAAEILERLERLEQLVQEGLALVRQGQVVGQFDEAARPHTARITRPRSVSSRGEEWPQ